MAAAPRQRIDPEWMRQMDTIRTRHREIYDLLTDWEDGADPGVVIATVFGLRDDVRFHWAEKCRRAIEYARDRGYTWRQIAAAAEGSDDEKIAARVQAKQHWRNESWEAFMNGIDDFDVPPDNGGMPSV